MSGTLILVREPALQRLAAAGTRTKESAITKKSESASRNTAPVSMGLTAITSAACACVTTSPATPQTTLRNAQ